MIRSNKPHACISLLAILGASLSAVANTHHGSAGAFKKFSRQIWESTQNKVLNESLPVFWSEDGKQAVFHLETEPGKRSWRKLDLDSGKVTKISKKPKDFEEGKKAEEYEQKPESKSASRSKSPDGKHEVAFKDGRVILDGKPVGPTLEDGWVWTGKQLWAPDSSRLVVWKNTTHPVRKVHLVEASPKDQLQPKYKEISYPKPGDTLNIARPVILFADGRKPMELDESLIQDPFSLKRFTWRKNSYRLVFNFIERGFGSHRVIEMNSQTGKQRILIDESDEKFVYVYGNGFHADLKDGDEILWASERDGWNHLYLFDGRTGKGIRRITSGEQTFRDVVKLDEDSREAFVRMSGCYPDQDPYYIHLARVDLDKGSTTMLTEGDGTHTITWSPDGKYFVDQWSRVDQPPVHEIRRSSDGKQIAVLSEAGDTKLLEAEGWAIPERFVTKDRNGEFDIHGVIMPPRNFDPKKEYPVIEAIYAGPHGSFAPKSWKSWRNSRTEFTASDFFIVRLDGLGTNHRGKKFQQVAYKNIMDSGFPDRRKWITEAAKKFPQMDLTRVGIYGGSAGGQSSLAALLNHGDFYHAAAADCGCHDNQMDKIWWNEQWMDWPVGPHYEANSNLTHIDKLKGHLMLTVGELDTNVDPSSTYQVADRLNKADKDFELHIAFGAGHGAGEQPYMRSKRLKFFQKHLGNNPVAAFD